MLNPGGVFCNLEHDPLYLVKRTASFFISLVLPGREDKTNRLLSVENQLQIP